MKTRVMAFLAAGTGALLAGCTAASPQSSAMPSVPAGGGGYVLRGVVVGVEPVVIDGLSFYNPLFGIASPVVTKSMTRNAGQKITIKLDGADGNAVAIIQPTPPEFVAGDRVRVVNSGGRDRVEFAPAETAPPTPQPASLDSWRPAQP